MTLSALSLAALPAATGLARQVAQTGQEVGSGFLSMLSKLAGSAVNADASSVSETTDVEAADTADGSDSATGSVAERTRAWCQKLLGWIGEQQGGGATGDVDLHLTLDELDQPQVRAEGPASDAIQSALAQDPTWLQEYRELALDRMAEQGQLGPAAAAAPPMTLHIQRRDGQLLIEQ